MTVYLLTCEPYHDTSCIVGIYASLEAAKAGDPECHGHEWDADGYYVQHWGAVAQLDLGHDNLYLIRAYEVQGG